MATKNQKGAKRGKFVQVAPPMEHCPKCGQEFDPREASIYECPRCGQEGSSACCNPGGNNCLCMNCECGEDGAS